MLIPRVSFALLSLLLLNGLQAIAQDHSHGESAAKEPVQRPKVFLDKSPRIVEYQLKRLDNQRLLLVERKADDAKYIPVYQAILTRVGMSPKFREEAVEALVELQDSNAVAVLLGALDKFDLDDPQERRAARQLTAMLVKLDAKSLEERLETLWEAVDSDNAAVRTAGFSAMITAGKAEQSVLRVSKFDDDLGLDWLRAIPLVPSQEQRSELRDVVVTAVGIKASVQQRIAAIETLAHIPSKQAETFKLLAPFVSQPKLRTAAVRTLLKVPSNDRDETLSGELVEVLVKHAEETPAKDRTSTQFIDAMQLADQLLARLPTKDARNYRKRLGEVTVRVVRIKTVEEEMRYDIPYFAVEAGRSVQVVLENHDLMPHNLVFTTPGALKEVAQLGLQVGPNNGWKGLQYVPESDKVLFATQMVAADKQEALTFKAPKEPGEYPYVCTFPQHWYRMYGVMVVVEDLDAWLKDPVEPANPIGSNRTFVQKWTVDELKGELDAGLRGRTPDIGKRLFAEASCAGCHKVQGEGGVIGPDLTETMTRWKGDRVGVLREILDPSHKVDAKYAMQKVLTFDGQTYSGVLVKEDDDNITLLANAEAEPVVIPQDDIDAMVPSSVSMMPKALLDQYTKDEIFEILSYIESVDPNRK